MKNSTSMLEHSLMQRWLNFSTNLSKCLPKFNQKTHCTRKYYTSGCLDSFVRISLIQFLLYRTIAVTQVLFKLMPITLNIGRSITCNEIDGVCSKESPFSRLLCLFR